MFAKAASTLLNVATALLMLVVVVLLVDLDKAILSLLLLLQVYGSMYYKVGKIPSPATIGNVQNTMGKERCLFVLHALASRHHALASSHHERHTTPSGTCVVAAIAASCVCVVQYVEDADDSGVRHGP
jgi:hypothetical protein